jgi:hypothetical protein
MPRCMAGMRCFLGDMTRYFPGHRWKALRFSSLLSCAIDPISSDLYYQSLTIYAKFKGV